VLLYLGFREWVLHCFVCSVLQVAGTAFSARGGRYMSEVSIYVHRARHCACTWKINHSSPYSGLFQARTNVPVIVRASVSLSGTKQRDKRAFGMAIKLSPILKVRLLKTYF